MHDAFGGLVALACFGYACWKFFGWVNEVEERLDRLEEQRRPLARGEGEGR